MKAASKAASPRQKRHHTHSNSTCEGMKISSGSKPHNHRMIMPQFLRLDSTGEVSSFDRPVRNVTSAGYQRTNTCRQGASVNAKNGQNGLLGKVMCHLAPQPSPSSNLLAMSQIKNDICALDELLSMRRKDTVAMAEMPSHVKMAQSNMSRLNRYGQWGTMCPNYPLLPQGVFPCHVFRALQTQRESQKHVWSTSIGQRVFELKNGSSLRDSLLVAWSKCSGGNSSSHLQKINTMSSTDSIPGDKTKVSPAESQATSPTASCVDTTTSSVTCVCSADTMAVIDNSREAVVSDLTSNATTLAQDEVVQNSTTHLKEQASLNSQKCTVGTSDINSVVESQNDRCDSELEGTQPPSETESQSSSPVECKSNFQLFNSPGKVCGKGKDITLTVDSVVSSLTPESKVTTDDGPLTHESKVTTDDGPNAKEPDSSDELLLLDDSDWEYAETLRQRYLYTTKMPSKVPSSIVGLSVQCADEAALTDESEWDWEESEDEEDLVDCEQSNKLWDCFVNNQFTVVNMLPVSSSKQSQAKQEESQDGEPEEKPRPPKPCPAVTKKWNQLYASVSVADHPCKVLFHCGEGKDTVHEYEKGEDETLTVMEIQKARDLTRQNKGKAAKLLQSKCAQDPELGGDGGGVHNSILFASSDDGLNNLTCDGDVSEEDASSSESEDENGDDEVDDDDDDDIVFE